MKILQELTGFQCKNDLKKLDTKVLGRNYICFDEIDSTQKEIWRQIDNKKIKNGLLIRAKRQTSGIGTHGRIWYSTENNITFSFYMELNCDISKIKGITTEIANVIISIIKEKYNVNVDIKLPNDLYINGKKLGGILTESKVRGNVVKFVVIGIGINNSQLEFNDELKNIATSLKKEYGIELNTENFIAEFCNKLEKIILKRIG